MARFRDAAARRVGFLRVDAANRFAKNSASRSKNKPVLVSIRQLVRESENNHSDPASAVLPPDFLSAHSIV
jgi:hypothetical protein